MGRRGKTREGGERLGMEGWWGTGAETLIEFQKVGKVYLLLLLGSAWVKYFLYLYSF